MRLLVAVEFYVLESFYAVTLRKIESYQSEVHNICDRFDSGECFTRRMVYRFTPHPQNELEVNNINQ